MGVWGDINDAFTAPGRKIGHFLFGNPAQDEAKEYGQQLAPYRVMGQNPYQGGYDSLIKQYQDAAQNPQFARNQFQQFNNQALSNQLAMSHGRSPGAARTAMNNMSQLNQGLSQGQTQAALQEQMLARQGLQGTLNGASQQDFMRANANQQAYLQSLAAQLGMPTPGDKVMQALMAGGMLAGGGGK
jgi:hypothetical protein